ncbi:MAG: xanthine dehydrogenase family protein molybdopterin-binding subunit [Gaiellaceae bacterium]
MSVLGNRVLRKEDARFLRGEGTYVENMRQEDALHVTFARSLLAHARVNGVDTSAAEAAPDVVAVFTAADLDVGKFGPPPHLHGLNAEMGRPLIAGEVVRFVGEIVAVVVAKTRAAGADAAELVMVDYDPLPVVVSAAEAAKDEVLLFPEAGTNVAGRSGSPEHDEALFAGCDVVVSGTLVSPRMAPCPLEPRSVVATVDEDGRLTVWTPSQTPHHDRFGIAGALGLDPAQVRVVSPDVGGGFGAKQLSTDEIVLAWVARKLGRPVRWTETRSESMVALHHGRSMQIDFTLGGTRDGKVLAYRIDMLADGGAYPVLGSFLPNLTGLMASAVYAIPRIEVEGRSVVTNTTPITSFRGAGRPEATQTIERAMDLFAAELGEDPVEVRRRNLIPNDSFPYKTASGATYDSGDYERALDLVTDAAGYHDLREEQRTRREQGVPIQLGIGVSAYIEISNPVAETEYGEVEITADGSAIVRTGSCVHGQSHETTFAQIVSSRLGLPIEKIDVHKGDTDEIAKGTGTYGSKSTQLGGSAVRGAADAVVEQAKALAAEYGFADGELDPAAWAELAERAAADGRLGELKAVHEFKSPPSFPFGAHLAVVEVDVETGKVELLRLVAVDDAGTVINPLIVEGQVHGGVATGVAQALYEEYSYDEDGTPLTSTFVGYAFPSAADLPSWEFVEMETPTPNNPLGAKGIGESGTMGATPAVQSAVVDALSPYGVRHVDMPVNGENVWRALQAAQV